MHHWSDWVELHRESGPWRGDAGGGDELRGRSAWGRKLLREGQTAREVGLRLVRVEERECTHGVTLGREVLEREGTGWRRLEEVRWGGGAGDGRVGGGLGGVRERPGGGGDSGGGASGGGEEKGTLWSGGSSSSSSGGGGGSWSGSDVEGGVVGRERSRGGVVGRRGEGALRGWDELDVRIGVCGEREERDGIV